VVTEQTLHQTLSSVWDPEKAALQLVELAIRGGGPDNITCIVADVVDTQTTALPPTRVPVLAGAASHGSTTEPRAPDRQNSPATRAMRLARTNPQQALPDEEDARSWSNGYNGYAGRQKAADDAETGGRHSHRARRRPPDDEDDDYTALEPREGKRRWPIVTTLLVVLVLLIGGGLYGGWRYVQGQYFIGVQGNNVAIFRGVNQNLLGISLSSPVQRTNLPVSQVVPSDQAMLRQTIARSSLHDAQNLVGQIQSAVNDCRQQYETLAIWQAANTSYLRAKAAYNAAIAAKKKPKPTPPRSPGAEPTVPDSADCAPSTAFGIPASALPTGQPTTQPTTAPTTRPSTTPSARVTPKASSTARK
jgi:protein phosphatase